MSGSSDEVAVRLVGVGKRYTKYDDTPTLLGSVLRFRSKTTRSQLWALRGVDLEVRRGETVGVIGRNGAGKSTMLQLLAGVTAPTEGNLEVRGRVAPLIAVGVGFHPELTGRENVYVNGTVLGLTREEIDDRFDSIVDFAEIPDFIDTPVKFYSSGMYVRLGFSVAVAAHPEILLVDEVLAVGDIQFQAKCFDRMAEMKASGATILVVSHNMNAVRRLCERVMVINGGRPVFFGDVDEAISNYHRLLADGEGSSEAAAANSAVDLPELSLHSSSGEQTAHFDADETLLIRARTRFRRAVADPTFVVHVLSAGGQVVYAETHPLVGSVIGEGEHAEIDVRCRLSVPTGSYVASIGIGWGGTVDEAIMSPGERFFVAGRRRVKGVADLGGDFNVRVGDGAALNSLGEDLLVPGDGTNG